MFAQTYRPAGPMPRLAPALMLTLLIAPPAMAEEVVVFAAASLKGALDRVAADWQARTGHRVTISYAGSNALAAQILQGAPADILVSAAEDWMDKVARAGLVAARRDLLGTSLVLIAHGRDAAPVQIGPGLDLPALLNGGRLAMAMVDAVPAGQYGKAALQSLGLWDSVAAEIAQAENVRAALAFVARGEAPLGIVYATDAAAGDNVTVIATFPQDTHPPIVYPAALLTAAGDAADRAFFAALSEPAADAVFAAAGFALPE